MKPLKTWMLSLILVLAALSLVWIARPLSYVAVARKPADGFLNFGHNYAASEQWRIPKPFAPPGGRFVQAFEPSGPNVAALALFTRPGNELGDGGVNVTIRALERRHGKRPVTGKTLLTLTRSVRQLSRNGLTMLYWQPIPVKPGQAFLLEIVTDKVALLADEEKTVLYAVYSKVPIWSLSNVMYAPGHPRPLAPLSLISLVLLALAISAIICLRLVLDYRSP